MSWELHRMAAEQQEAECQHERGICVSECNPNYCDSNHNGNDHEWKSYLVVGDPQDPGEPVAVCKHCGVEK